MPKNSQYGRWRRAAMQAVMWVVFGSTLALAGYVSHRRTASMEAPLGEPVRFGSLIVRPPRGWDREESADAGPMQLILKERDEEGRPRRQVRVTQERQAAGKWGPAYYLETQLKIPSVRGDLPAERFNFLGGRGVLLVWRGIPRGLLMDIDADAADRFPDPGLYACTVLPDGLVVTLQMRGEGAYGPTNRVLLRQLADTLQRADGGGTPLAPTAVE